MTADRRETLLWTVLRRFEEATLERYAEFVPELVTPAKKDVVEELRQRAPSDAPLTESELGAPIAEVLDAARSGDAEQTLCIQGLVLELLGRAIYAAAESAETLAEASLTFAERGRRACEATAEAASRRIAEQIGTGEAAFEVFAHATHDVIAALDALAEPVDRTFAERFGVRYADLLGEFSADLVVACQALEMPRRKVAAHLAGASMGF